MNYKNKICPFCGEKISGRAHLKKCNPNIDENKAFIMMVEITYDCNVNHIINEYELGFSLPEIKNKYGMSFKTITNILKINNIPIRSIKEASNENRLNKYKETCIKNYGVDNVSKLSEIKKKKKNTFLINYGVDNIFKSNEFKENLNNIMIEKYGMKRITNPEKISNTRNNFSEEKRKKIKSRTENTYRIKYGVNHYTKTREGRRERSEIICAWWNSLSSDELKRISENKKLWWENRSDEQKNIFSEQRKRYFSNMSDTEFEDYFNRTLKTISRLELKVKKILDDNLIEYTQQKFVNRKSYDFRINNTKILIEVQGDYWHANPVKYKHNDLIKYPNKKLILANKIWEKDEIKRINAEKYGYNVIYLWESDVNQSIKNGTIDEFILNTLYENT